MSHPLLTLLVLCVVTLTLPHITASDSQSHVTSQHDRNHHHTSNRHHHDTQQHQRIYLDHDMDTDVDADTDTNIHTKAHGHTRAHGHARTHSKSQTHTDTSHPFHWFRKKKSNPVVDMMQTIEFQQTHDVLIHSTKKKYIIPHGHELHVRKSPMKPIPNLQAHFFYKRLPTDRLSLTLKFNQYQVHADGGGISLKTVQSPSSTFYLIQTPHQHNGKPTYCLYSHVGIYIARQGENLVPSSACDSSSTWQISGIQNMHPPSQRIATSSMGLSIQFDPRIKQVEQATKMRAEDRKRKHEKREHDKKEKEHWQKEHKEKERREKENREREHREKEHKQKQEIERLKALVGMKPPIPPLPPQVTTALKGMDPLKLQNQVKTMATLLHPPPAVPTTPPVLIPSLVQALKQAMVPPPTPPTTPPIAVVPAVINALKQGVDPSKLAQTVGTSQVRAAIHVLSNPTTIPSSSPIIPTPSSSTSVTSKLHNQQQRMNVLWKGMKQMHGLITELMKHMDDASDSTSLAHYTNQFHDIQSRVSQFHHDRMKHTHELNHLLQSCKHDDTMKQHVVDRVASMNDKEWKEEMDEIQQQLKHIEHKAKQYQHNKAHQHKNKVHKHHEHKDEDEDEDEDELTIDVDVSPHHHKKWWRIKSHDKKSVHRKNEDEDRHHKKSLKSKKEDEDEDGDEDEDEARHHKQALIHKHHSKLKKWWNKQKHNAHHQSSRLKKWYHHQKSSLYDRYKKRFHNKNHHKHHRKSLKQQYHEWLEKQHHKSSHHHHKKSLKQQYQEWKKHHHSQLKSQFHHFQHKIQSHHHHHKHPISALARKLLHQLRAMKQSNHEIMQQIQLVKQKALYRSQRLISQLKNHPQMASQLQSEVQDLFQHSHEHVAKLVNSMDQVTNHVEQKQPELRNTEKSAHSTIEKNHPQVKLQRMKNRVMNEKKQGITADSTVTAAQVSNVGVTDQSQVTNVATSTQYGYGTPVSSSTKSRMTSKSGIWIPIVIGAALFLSICCVACIMYQRSKQQPSQEYREYEEEQEQPHERG